MSRYAKADKDAKVDKYTKAAGISFLIAAVGGLERMINGDLIGFYIGIAGAASGFGLLAKKLYDWRSYMKKNYWKYKSYLEYKF